MILRNVNTISLGFQMMLSMTRPMIPLYASSLGANTWDIGLLTAAYSFFPLMLAIYAGRLADHAGDRLPVASGIIGSMIGLVLPFCFPSMWALFVSQFIVGISQVFIQVSLQNVLGNAATQENRDYYFSMFSMTVALGGVFGPVAAGYLADHFSFATVFLTSVFMGLLPLILCPWIPVIIRPNQQDRAEHEGSSFTLLKIPVLRKALASSALVLYSRDTFVAYFPLLAMHLHISATAIGWIITIQSMMMVTVRFFLSRLTVRFGRNRILLASILTAGLAFLLVPFAGRVYVLCLLSALMGLGLGCGQPLSMTTTYNASPKSRTGEVLGLRLAANRLSQLIAPLFFGLLGSSAGLISVFYVSGAFLIGGAFLTKSRDEETITANGSTVSTGKT
ncbi:MFS transporter [Paenibacillus rigui]|uniref:MFS transporter n=1 Tax=Paenibacillus rigui TaxID=554312 RepID=A0A229ULQ4_9BACL|nr:MFS transporter [Paenibacillus rigui]OXM84311.1 MFS transporter [Paenibacillus rigui]